MGMSLRFKSFINFLIISLPLVVEIPLIDTIHKLSPVEASSDSTYTFNFLNSNMTTSSGEVALTSGDKTITWSYSESTSMSISEDGALTISSTYSWSMTSDISSVNATITSVAIDVRVGGYSPFVLEVGSNKKETSKNETITISDISLDTGNIKIYFDGNNNKDMTINNISITMIPKEVITTPIISWGSSPSTSMKIGEIQTLDIIKNEVAKEGNITITSSDTSVISVNGLDITALQEGTSTIVVSLDLDGCNTLSIDISVCLIVRYKSTGSGDYLKVTNISNLLDEDKFLIVNEVDNRYALESIVSGGSLDRSSGISITDGAIKASEIYQSKLLLTAYKSTSGYLLKSEGSGYLGINEDKFTLSGDTSTFWNISIADGVTTIGSGAYHIVYEGSSFKLSSNSSNIAIYRLDNTSIKEVEVPTSLKEAIDTINNNYLTCDKSGVNSIIDWSNIKTTVEALDESNRNILTNLILPTDGVYNAVEAFVSRYDYIICKYNYEDFLSRYPSSNSNSLSLFNNDNIAYNNMTLMIVISLCSLSLLMGIVLLKKKRDC